MLRLLSAICILAQLANANDPGFNYTGVFLPRKSEETNYEWQGFTLDCGLPDDVDGKANFCLWKIPGKDEDLSPQQLKIEGVKASMDDSSCSIEFQTYKEEFDGKWDCRLWAGDEEIRKSFLIMPTDLSKSIEITEEIDNATNTYDYTCTIDFADGQQNALPKFKWFMDDENVDDKYKTQHRRNWTEHSYTLKFVPQMDDVNKTLKCVVDWAPYDIDYVLKATVELSFSDAEIIAITANHELSQAATNSSAANNETDLSVTILGIFLGIAFGCGVIALITTRCYRSLQAKKPDIIQDEETGSGTTQEEESNEKVEPEEKKDEDEKQEVTETTEKKSRFGGFLAKYFKRDAVADKTAAENTAEDKAVKMADVQSAAEEEKPQEFEPETKPEQVTQEAQEEAAGDQKAEPTPNTSF